MPKATTKKRSTKPVSTSKLTKHSDRELRDMWFTFGRNIGAKETKDSDFHYICFEFIRGNLRYGLHLLANRVKMYTYSKSGSYLESRWFGRLIDITLTGSAYTLIFNEGKFFRFVVVTDDEDPKESWVTKIGFLVSSLVSQETYEAKMQDL